MARHHPAIPEPTTPIPADGTCFAAGLLQEVVDDLTEVVCRFQADGTLLFVNQVYCRVFGKQVDELIGKKWHPVAFAEDLPLIEERLAQLSPANPIVTVENRVYDGNGAIQWMEFVNRAFYDEAGTLRHIQAVGRNISERKKFEMALQASERRLQLALEAATEGVWDWDLVNDEAYLSPKYWEMTGHEPHEHVANLDFLRRLVHPDDREHVLAAIRKHINQLTPDSDLEYRMITKDGRTLWLRGKGRVVERDAGGRATRMIGTVADITTRKLAEIAAKAAQTRFNCLSEENIVGVVITTAQGKIVEANDYYLEILGYGRQELEAGLVDWRLATPPECLHKDEAALKQMERTGRCSPYEKEYVRPDGQRRSVLVGFVRLPDTEGQILAVVLDITNRKRAKDEILRLNASLEKLVAERTASLQSATKDLQGFTYAASHDMKGPLGRIRNFSDLLCSKYADQLDGDGQLFIGLIQENAARLNLLVEDLLALVQIGRNETQAERIDLGAIVSALVAERGKDIDKLGAHVRTEVPAHLSLSGNRMAFVQMLRNLLDNALKYSARAEPPRIEIGASQEGTCCRLWVTDNGIGIPPEYRDTVFDIFRRLHTYQEYPGNGVGLALVRKVAEGMGGRAWVDSQLGQGATFYVEVAAPDGHPETGQDP